MTEILDNVAIPRKQSNRMIDEWPIEELAVAQCFMVNCDDNAEDKIKIERRLRAAASRYGRRLDRKYAVRRVDNKKIGLWRMA